ncbi:MAG: hypothetical protein DSY82_02475 [Flavobacteriia bacterium]|nr:MAG: hypothetical protein DSY82_02475 [Flavobacteriia bacterium]
MNHLKIIFFLIFLPLYKLSFAQEIRTESVKEYPMDADRFIGADVLNNIKHIVFDKTANLK